MVNNDVILVVDDDLAVLDTTATLLELFGYEVVTAHDGYDALLKFEQFHPQLVFLDVKMPKMDGYKTFFEMKKNFPKSKIILMTAHADYSKWDEAKKNNALEIIEKPYSAELLKKLVTKYCHPK